MLLIGFHKWRHGCHLIIAYFCVRAIAVSKNEQGGNKVARISESVSGVMIRSDGEPESARAVRGIKDIG